MMTTDDTEDDGHRVIARGGLNSVCL
jgi:hypothetical protein